MKTHRYVSLKSYRRFVEKTLAVWDKATPAQLTLALGRIYSGMCKLTHRGGGSAVDRLLASIPKTNAVGPRAAREVTAKTRTATLSKKRGWPKGMPRDPVKRKEWEKQQQAKKGAPR
jgi:hypothetical protein